MTLEKIAKIANIKANEENLAILSLYKDAIKSWLESSAFKDSHWASHPYPPLLDPSTVVYEEFSNLHAWTLNLPLPKHYDFVLFGSHAAGMHAAVPGFMTLCGVCARVVVPKQNDVKNEENKGSFGCYGVFYQQLLAMKKVKEQGYVKKSYIQVTNLLLDSDAKKFYSLIDTSVAINVIRDPISALRTFVTLPNLPDDFKLEEDKDATFGFLFCDDPEAAFKSGHIRYAGALDPFGKHYPEQKPCIDSIPAWLKDKEQLFHDGTLYDYFRHFIDKLYIKQTSDFAGGRGFETMIELSELIGFDAPSKSDRWLFQKHVGEMKNLLPIIIYASDETELYFQSDKKTTMNKDILKHSAKLVLCTAFHESNRLKPERDISSLFSLPDPLLRVFVTKPEDAAKLLRSERLLSKAQQYICRLSAAVLDKAAELEANRKLFSETDILEYLRTHERERKMMIEMMKEHLKELKVRAPHIIQSWQHYKKFQELCLELDGIEI